MLERRDDLGFLEEPFTNIEIDAVVKSLPNDKSPGLDGFSNEFLKKMLANHKGRFLHLMQGFLEQQCLP